MVLVFRICGARVGQWCAYGRKYSETGRAAPMSPAEAAVGVTIRCMSRISLNTSALMPLESCQMANLMFLR